MTDRKWKELGLREAVVNGDESAWRFWYEDEYPRLEAFANWRCGNLRDLVDDVLQETWMIAIRRIRDFEPEKSSFHHWLCGIASNAIRNQLRSYKRRSDRFQPILVEPSGATMVEQDEDRGEKIARALAELNDRYEMVLRLKYLEQKTVFEISNQLQESEKTIESLLSRARQAFRDAYSGSEKL